MMIMRLNMCGAGDMKLLALSCFFNYSSEELKRFSWILNAFLVLAMVYDIICYLIKKQTFKKLFSRAT